MGAAVELGCVDDVSVELRGVKELAENLGGYLRDPRIMAEEKAAMVNGALSGSVGRLTLEFTSMLLKRNHWKYLPSIVGQYERMCDDHNHKVSVFLHIPFEPERETLDRMETRFIEKGLIPEDAEEIKLLTVKDKDIIGGFIAYCNGRQIDASLRTQLVKIRRAER